MRGERRRRDHGGRCGIVPRMDFDGKGQSPMQHREESKADNERDADKNL